MNIQQLISEYKQKLNQAIRKEDKDLIMKNIMAYQQMINANPHVGNRPGQTQAFLSPTQLAQLGILGMSPNVQQVSQQQ